MKNEKFNKIVLACSGVSNTGAYSDKVSRRLMKDGKAKMLCLARFAIDQKFVDATKNEIPNYDEVIDIDGCPINCAERIIEKLEINSYTHINITDYGIIKGKTLISEDKTNEIIDSILKNNSR
jgi:uncharacterized metal-binding protein